MSNEEHSKQNEIKRNNTFHKNPNKIPELQVKVGQSQMNYKEYKLNDINHSKTRKIKSPISKKLYLNDNKLIINNNRNIEQNINQRITSEDNVITDNELYSPRRLKKSNLKRISTTVCQINDQKKSVKFAGKNSEEPLQTIIYIHNEDKKEKDEDKENKEKVNCDCACFIF